MSRKYANSGRISSIAPFWPEMRRAVGTGERQLDGEVVHQFQVAAVGGEAHVEVEDGGVPRPVVPYGHAPHVVQALEPQRREARVEDGEVGRQALERSRLKPERPGGSLALAGVVQREGGRVVDAPDPRYGVGDARRAGQGRGAYPHQTSALLDAARRRRVDAAHPPDQEEQVGLRLPPHVVPAPEADLGVEVGHGERDREGVLRGAGDEGGRVLHEAALLQEEAAGVADPQQGGRGLLEVGGDVGHRLVGQDRRDQDGVRSRIAHGMGSGRGSPMSALTTSS